MVGGKRNRGFSDTTQGRCFEQLPVARQWSPAGSGPAEAAPPGNLLEMQFSGPTPDLRKQTLGQGPAIPVLTSPPGVPNAKVGESLS